MKSAKNSTPSTASCFVALLRGINVGGRKAIAMSVLRDFLGELGCTDVRSLLQSGNLVFSSAAKSEGELEHLFEARASRQLGLKSDFFVRSAEDWARLVAANPFPEEAARDPSHVMAACLKAAPAAQALGELRGAISGKEVVAAVGRTLYAVYPDGIGRSKLTHALIEKKLGTRGTARNWNTVLKLAAACGAAG